MMSDMVKCKECANADPDDYPLTVTNVRSAFIGGNATTSELLYGDVGVIHPAVDGALIALVGSRFL